MGDIVEHHRLALGGDASGEPLADGDAHSGLHLLLEPVRGTRDERRAVLREEQHRGGVDDELVRDLV